MLLKLKCHIIGGKKEDKRGRVWLFLPHILWWNFKHIVLHLYQLFWDKQIIYLQSQFPRGSSQKFHSTHITYLSLLYFRKNQTCWTSLSLVLMDHSTREVYTNRICTFFISLKNGAKVYFRNSIVIMIDKGYKVQIILEWF